MSLDLGSEEDSDPDVVLAKERDEGPANPDCDSACADIDLFTGGVERYDEGICLFTSDSCGRDMDASTFG
jgi:hypothetical protein